MMEGDIYLNSNIKRWNANRTNWTLTIKSYTKLTRNIWHWSIFYDVLSLPPSTVHEQYVFDVFKDRESLDGVFFYFPHKSSFTEVNGS